MKTVISAENGPIEPNFSTTLPFELKPGRYVCIRWKPTTSKPISFNFAEGDFIDSNVLFHYNPRIGMNRVVRNAKLPGWGNEEIEGEQPFRVGKMSEIRLVVRQDFYEAFVDGKKHIEFKHRQAPDTAKYFFIKGEGSIFKVTFGDEGEDQATAECKQDLTIPHICDCDIVPGLKIYISGFPTAEANKFRIILHAGEDYAFTFAARLNDKVVVMNTKIDGDWKEKEKSTEFPFKHGEFFNMLIEVDADKYKLSVDDQHFTDFAHRVLPLSSIERMSVEGDVTLRCVCLQ